MGKTNPILAAQERMLEARYRARLHESRKIGDDAVIIMLEDALGIVGEAAVEALRVYQDTMNEIARMVVEDSNDDPDAEWSRAKVDDRILRSVGPENFKPWDERHK